MHDDERPGVPDSDQHDNSHAPKKRKTRSKANLAEPKDVRPPKRLRQKHHLTRIESVEEGFWTLPEEVMDVVCSYVSVAQLWYET